MRRFLFAVFMVVAGATGAAADSFEDGLSAYERGDYPQAMNLWRPLAAQGDARAQFKLGVMYRHGEGVPKDVQEAVTWYRRHKINPYFYYKVCSTAFLIVEYL